MRVMVLGATGFIGPAAVRRLGALGHEPIAVSRTGARVGTAESLAADRNAPAALARLAAERRTDAVVDLLGFTLAGAEPLIQALSGRIGRYVLASSGDVYAQYDGLHRKPGAPTPLERLAEDAPLRANPFPYRGETLRPAGDPQAWMDDYDKIPIERAALAQAGLEGTVVRLPMVYGPGDRNRRFGWAIGPMLAGAPAIEIDAQWAAWRSGYGYVDDVAEGLALAAVHPTAAGRTYNVGPREAVDHAAWAGRFAEVLDWRGEVRRLAREKTAPPLRTVLDRLDLAYPIVLDSTRIRAELGYLEPTPADDALARTVADERARSAV